MFLYDSFKGRLGQPHFRFRGAGKRLWKGMMRRIAILAIGIALLLPSVALAQSSTCQSYNRELCSEVATNSNNSGTTGTTGTSTTSPTSTTAQQSGTLPFTGVDVALLAIGGATLLSAGFAVRLLSRRLN